jgi:GrpB-like predicted nucleotidyltransferase (UPF0157 family)
LHPLREDEPDQPAHLRTAERAPPPMDHRGGGRDRPSQYSEAMARILLARVEDGQTMAQIDADPDVPCVRTIYRWLRRWPDFACAWDEVRSGMASERRDKVERFEQGKQRWEEIRARHEGRKPRQKCGRKSTWTPARGEAFCELIFEGLGMRQACARPGQPDPPMLYRWLRNHPEFREDYLVAAQARDARMADEVLELAEAAEPGTVRATKARIKAVESRMARLRPVVWRWD